MSFAGAVLENAVYICWKWINQGTNIVSDGVFIAAILVIIIDKNSSESLSPALLNKIQK